MLHGNLYLGSTEVKLPDWPEITDAFICLICLTHSQSTSQSSTMKAFIFSSALLLALASANTCDDCTAVMNTMVDGLTSDEGIAAQQVCAV